MNTLILLKIRFKTTSNYGVEGSHFEIKDNVLSEDIIETSITSVQ